MNLHEIRVFLAVAEELHFGRAAERLFLSQPQVSRVVAAMEQRIGGTLFQRTSRSVRLTPLGADLRDRLRPAVEQIDRAYDAARAFARGTTGVLWIGCTVTTSGRALSELLEQFRAEYPDCSVVLREQPLMAPYLGLESHDVDVMVFWQAGHIDDVTFGPAIERRDRVLAVASGHPFAERASVSIEEVADFALPDWAADPARREFMSPNQTPAGRPIARAGSLCHTLSEALDLVARGDVVHTTVDSLAEAQRHRTDLTFVPIDDLPPLVSGLMWRTADDNARIRALADVARRLGEHPATS